MDISTLAIYSILLANTVASSMLLAHKYMFNGTALGVNHIGYGALFLGLSFTPLTLGFTQSSTAAVLFSNSTHIMAFSFLLVGITILRGASRILLKVAALTTLFAIGAFTYYSVIVSSVSARIEIRSTLVLVLCLLAYYANCSGINKDSSRARMLLNIALVSNILYMSFRTLFALSHAPIGDYYSAAEIHKLSFVITTLTMVSLAVSVFWMLTDRLLKQTYRSSITDELTGLYNRRGLKEFIPKLILNGGRTNVSVLMADLDHFKDINDTYGHDCGDHVIKHFAQVLNKTCRKCDFCFRYGGEEFIVVLPNTDKYQARHIANRIREYVKSHSTVETPAIEYTVSIGLSQAQTSDDWMQLVSRVDQALYTAKSQGRDCVALI